MGDAAAAAADDGYENGGGEGGSGKNYCYMEAEVSITVLSTLYSLSNFIFSTTL